MTDATRSLYEGLPRLISSPDEGWFAALVPTQAEAIDVFVDEVGFEREGLEGEVQEIRLARAPVPESYVDEYPEWFEKNENGLIVAWEMRT